jgi:tetratricopeptide (TPR) repeat protein
MTTQTCSRCGARNVASRFCTKCGAQAAERSPSHSHTRGDAAAFNYDDFGFCPDCQAVNLIAASCCKGCAKDVKMVPLPGSYFRSTEFWILLVIVVVGFMALPVSIPVAIRLVYMIFRHSSEQTQARERIRLESKKGFNELKNAQIEQATRRLSDGEVALASGRWQQAYDLFQESMMLGELGSAQRFGAALAACKSGLFKEALAHAERIDDYRATDVAELLVRCHLGIGRFDHKSLCFVAQALSGLPPDLQAQVEDILPTEWMKAPFQDEKIEAVFLKLRGEKAHDARYQIALARYRVLQGHPQEALSMCEGIPSQLHSEESLSLYSELLRARGDVTEKGFEVALQLWKLVPGDSENALFLVKCCIRAKDLGRAEAVVRSAMIHHPDDQRLRYHLAVVLKLAGRTQDCIGEPQELLRSPEESAFRSQEEVSLLMIRCLIESGLHDAAHRQAQGMIRSREVLELLYELGLRYSEAGKNEKANNCWADIYSVDVRFRDVATRLKLDGSLVA